ncbi:MAG: AmmeMemoRadiSam system protein A [Candidatus Diapherotrites archaeon]|nr:AmmeMemoRadiSam system protein A [Candidatus Diapherotrites archaeon]
MNLIEGKKLVKLARKSIEYFFNHRKLFESTEKSSDEFGGAFVTINAFPEKELRGCIGYTQPIYPLNELIIHAAFNACFQDPRFPSLIEEELEKIVFEVSVLTAPQEFKCKKEELLKKIIIGKHGLIVSDSMHSGLLLPQVATEYKIDSKTFLEWTCEKAGLNKNAWKEKNIKIEFFEAEIFKEIKPKGEIIKK